MGDALEPAVGELLGPTPGGRLVLIHRFLQAIFFTQEGLEGFRAVPGTVQPAALLGTVQGEGGEDDVPVPRQGPVQNRDVGSLLGG